MTTSDLDSLIETISQIGNNKREIFLILSSDEFMNLAPHTTHTEVPKNFRGIGGNIRVYKKNGISIYLKIEI